MKEKERGNERSREGKGYQGKRSVGEAGTDKEKE